MIFAAVVPSMKLESQQLLSLFAALAKLLVYGATG
jgi:hypothetical protein